MKFPLLGSDVENHVEPFEKFEGDSRSFAAGLRAVWNRWRERGALASHRRRAIDAGIDDIDLRMFWSFLAVLRTTDGFSSILAGGDS
jgi:hypothetical protein